MEFVANLRPRTVQAFAKHRIHPSAYLLSTHRATSTMLRHAHALREEGIPLFADNGSKPLIDAVIDSYKEASRPITAEVRQVRRQLGRIPRGKAVPLSLRRRASELARAVVRDCTMRSERIDWKVLLEQQLAMRPTHLIAQEDFAVACLIALDLEREITGWPVEYFKRRNRRSLGLWNQVVEDKRCRGIKVYAVLSAMDYNTARSAGELAASFGATHIAIGMAGIMLDRNAVDFYVKGYGSYMLDQPAPRRYVRFAEVTSGIAEGYRRANVRLESFHGLGLGAASLFPVLATAMASETTLTVDATSPIHDAVRDHVMYDPVRNGTRMSSLHIARRIVQDSDWSFVCPFCQAFREKYGHHPDAAREWWLSEGQPVLTSEHLQRGEPLYDALPLFSELDAPLAQEASRVRIAHNHWVLGELTRAVPDGPNRRDWARKEVEKLLNHGSMTTTRGLRAAVKVL